MEAGEITRSEIAGVHRRRDAVAPPRALATGRRRLGVALSGLAAAAQLSWLVWWITHLPVNLVAPMLFAAELVGLASTLAIAVGLARARRPREVFVDDRRESHRFAFAVADIVGRTRSTDVHRDAALAVRDVVRRRPQRSAEAAMAAVLLDGPRRLLVVAGVTLCLLLGIAPMPVPPPWVVAAWAAGVALSAGSHVVLGRGRVRIGDRVRWSYSSLGEVVGATDRDDVAPRRWVGAMATVVVVNIAIALRGTSDRWTHGLRPMSHDERLVTMALGIGIVVGALFTMRTVQAPVLDPTRWSRRLEERTARRSTLAATVAFGLVGLIAGVLPGGVDASHDDTVRIEQVVDDQTGTVDG